MPGTARLDTLRHPPYSGATPGEAERALPGEPLITPAMNAALNAPSHPQTFEVRREDILRFAQAIGDPNPLFSGEGPDHPAPEGGPIAPPTFLRSLLGAIPPLPDGESLPRVLDGGSAWEYFQPVRPGDRITAVARLESLTEREGRLGRMLFTVYAIEYTDQRGTSVVTQRNTLIRY